MDFLEIAKNRYTTKKYNPNKRIPEEQVNILKEIIRLSPSSINSQPWKFAFVSDGKTKSKLAGASFFNEHKVSAASHIVVFYAIDDIDKFENQIEGKLPPEPVAYYLKNIKPLAEAEIKAWFGHQVYLSLGFFLSACAAMGIDSTPMEGIDKESYDKILHIDGYKPLFAVAIGTRDAGDTNQLHTKPKYRLKQEDIVLSIND